MNQADLVDSHRRLRCGEHHPGCLHWGMSILGDRVLLHLADGRRLPVDPREVYLLDAEGGETLIRTRHAEPLVDVRQLAELVPLVEPYGFYQVHRSWAVNLYRVAEIRPTTTGGWEVKLDPPVNRVLPVSRRRVAGLWARFGE